MLAVLMGFSFVVLINFSLLTLILAFSTAYDEHACACNATNAWLDVMLVIDNSALAGADGLASVCFRIDAKNISKRFFTNYFERKSLTCRIIGCGTVYLYVP